MSGKAGKYASYKRIHRSAEHPSDLENAKIHRETSRSLKRRGLADRLGRDLADDPGDDSAADLYNASIASAERDRRNAKGHKRRLKELRKHRDFV